VSEERRAYQRLQLPDGVTGRFADRDVSLIELSATGTHIRCGDEIAVGTRAPLRFTWRGETVDVPAEVVWCEDGRAGLRFGDYPDVLRRLLEAAVTERLRAEEPPAVEVFVTWTLDDGVWTRRPSLHPEQPPNGFTVRASEPPENVDLLCRKYASGDGETRRLTRMFAELSVSPSVIH
jgi:hypothetical protein